MRRAALLLAAGLLAGCGQESGGPAAVAPPAPLPSPQRPAGPAPADFAPGVPVLWDSQWAFPLGGFGGGPGPVRRAPVVLVHGNQGEAGHWSSVREQLRAAGWSGSEVWALSYNGVPGPLTRAADNVEDLVGFVDLVRQQTGSDRVSVVAHSLGAVLVLEAVRQRPELREALAGVVSIAGPHGGTSLCPPGSAARLVSCDELTPGSPFLARLRDVDLGEVPVMAVLDGTGRGDAAFRRELADSPVLPGADVRRFPGLDHTELRDDPRAVAAYRDFLEKHGTLRR